jgi:putative membrane protein
MKFLLNILVGGIAIAIAAYIVPGITVASLWTAIIVALVLSIVNATIGLLLQAISMPLNFLTL